MLYIVGFIYGLIGIGIANGAERMGYRSGLVWLTLWLFWLPVLAAMLCWKRILNPLVCWILR